MIILDFILSLFFTALVLLMGWHILSIIDVKKRVINSAIAVTMLVFLSVATFWSLSTYRGYPTTDVYAKEYHLLWGVVKQPKDGDPGAIYLWLYEPKKEPTWWETKFGIELKTTPRAYEIPYDQKMEDELRKVLQTIREGGAGNVVFEKPGKKKKVASNDQKNKEKLVPRFSTIDPRQTLQKN